MDQEKIGKYIAAKRKNLGLTQKQIAEKLGMSDKSISKWERGICLPDASVYMELCSILGVTINELFAGEDIDQDHLEGKSEENLIAVTKDSQHHQKKLKRIIGLLILIAASAALLAAVLLTKMRKPENCIIPLANDSAEVQTAQLLSGTTGALFCNYHAKNVKTLTVHMYTYRKGGQVDEETAANLEFQDVANPLEGAIVLVPDLEHHTVKLVITGAGTISTEIPILTQEQDTSSYVSSWTSIEETEKIRYNSEQGLAAFCFGKHAASIPIEDFEQHSLDNTYNDYMYYFSVSFEK